MAGSRLTLNTRISLKLFLASSLASHTSRCSVPVPLSVKTTRPAKKDGAAPAWPKKAAKKGFHAPSRDKAGAPRRHYLVTTVTPAEKEAILKYCDKHGRSISSFLADIALEDAKQPAKSKLEDQEITLTLRLPARDIDKMRLFARLEQKSVEELLREFLQPGLQKRKAVAAVPMHTLRCWLSDDEHKTIKEYLANYGLSARSYLALLALKAINRC